MTRWVTMRATNSSRRSRRRLKARLGPKEFLSRFGGDEFVILTAPAAPQSKRDRCGARRTSLRFTIRLQWPKYSCDGLRWYCNCAG